MTPTPIQYHSFFTDNECLQMDNDLRAKCEAVRQITSELTCARCTKKGLKELRQAGRKLGFVLEMQIALEIGASYRDSMGTLYAPFADMEIKSWRD